MKLIVGLGNPGKDYERTRHNVGFELIDALAAAHGASVSLRRQRALTGRVVIAGTSVVLAKPMTFMNLSGDAVALLLAREAIGPADLLVVTDDIHLPPGRIRLRAQGSSGGQNGLKHIAQTLGTDAFARLRIGVGEPPPGRQIDWVLSRFTPDDRARVDDALILAQGAVAVFVADGIEAAMNRFNGTVVVERASPER